MSKERLRISQEKKGRKEDGNWKMEKEKGIEDDSKGEEKKRTFN